MLSLTALRKQLRAAISEKRCAFRSVTDYRRFKKPIPRRHIASEVVGNYGHRWVGYAPKRAGEAILEEIASLEKQIEQHPTAIARAKARAEAEASAQAKALREQEAERAERRELRRELGAKCGTPLPRWEFYNDEPVVVNPERRLNEPRLRLWRWCLDNGWSSLDVEKLYQGQEWQLRDTFRKALKQIAELDQTLDAMVILDSLSFT